MRKIKALLCLLPGLVFTKTMAQIYEEPNTGNVGIGITSIDNVQNWGRVLQLYGSPHAKLLVTSNNGPKVGIFSHPSFNGKIGTESNHDLTLTAGYWNDVMTLTTAAKVGIGTLNPTEKLSVDGNISWTGYNSGSLRGLKMGHSGGNYGGIGYNIDFTPTTGIFNRPALDQSSYLEFQYGGFRFYGTSVATAATGVNLNGSGNNLNLFAIITKEGNFGIGTALPKEKLSVNGKIRAQEIKVETTNWPDYVFAKSYQLPTLFETEKYIKENGHLPGIPSAGEVKTNGIDLGEMNAKLLEKIEELTLYMIEMKKANEKLNDRIKQLELKK